MTLATRTWSVMTVFRITASMSRKADMVLRHLRLSYYALTHYLDADFTCVGLPNGAVYREEKRISAVKFYRQNRIASELNVKHRIKHLKHLIHKAVSKNDFHGFMAKELLKEMEAISILKPNEIQPSIGSSYGDGAPETIYHVDLHLDHRITIGLDDTPHVDASGLGPIGVHRLILTCGADSISMPIWDGTVQRRLTGGI